MHYSLFLAFWTKAPRSAVKFHAYYYCTANLTGLASASINFMKQPISPPISRGPDEIADRRSVMVHSIL